MEENDRKDETTTETPATEAPTAETTAPVDQADGASTDPVEEKEPAPV